MDYLETLITQIVEVTKIGNSKELFETISISSEILAASEIATGEKDKEIDADSAKKFVAELQSTTKDEEFKYLRDQYAFQALENYLEEIYPALSDDQIDQIGKLLEAK